MAAATELDIANQALDLVGAEPIGEIGEETPNGERIERLYRPQVRDFLLSQHRWVFAAALARLAEAEPMQNTPLQHVFAPPSDLVGTIHAFRDQPNVDGPTLSVMQFGHQIASRCKDVWVEYTRAVPERDWPATFRSLAVHYLAAMLANSLQQQRRAAELRDQALGSQFDQGIDGGLLLKAKTEDGKSAPERQAFNSYDDGPLVGARYGGNSYWGGRGRFEGYGFGGPFDLSTGG